MNTAELFCCRERKKGKKQEFAWNIISISIYTPISSLTCVNNSSVCSLPLFSIVVIAALGQLLSKYVGTSEKLESYVISLCLTRWLIWHIKVQRGSSLLNPLIATSYLVCRLGWLRTAAAPTKRSCESAANDVAHGRAYCHPSSCGSHLGHEARPLGLSRSRGQGGRRWMSGSWSMRRTWTRKRTWENLKGTLWYLLYKWSLWTVINVTGH